ncbi:peroxiredoxin [bacterium SCN 62-11]|nr:peroxiredoxin [Candidatus Eremiobacteraeota bacterium]ODT65296.1 MAG: peroxiredoxin [bacterium SCN 62-11]
MPAELNVKAPDFELMSNKGESVKLSDKLAVGPVVLLFFPLAFSGVCTEEMCEFRDNFADFNGLNAQVFGISVDSRFALNAFAEKNNLEFPLLSDFNKEISKAYDAQYETFLGLNGVAKRSAFVIDKEGVIRYRSVSDDAKVKPNLSEIKDALKSL